MKLLTSIGFSCLTALVIAAEIDFIWENTGHWSVNSLGVTVSTVLCQIVLLAFYFRLPHLIAGIVRASGGTTFDNSRVIPVQMLFGGLTSALNVYIMFTVIRLKDALAMLAMK